MPALMFSKNLIAARALLLVALAVLSPIVCAQDARQSAAQLAKVEIKTDVEYGQAGDVKLKLDWAKPREPAAKKLPCIIWVHGGGWQGGDKSSGRNHLANYVTSGEYVGVSVGYRLTNVASWPAQIHDCKAAVRWVRAHAEELGIDPEKIGVWGSSAGGHLVAMLGTSGDVKELEGDLGSNDQSSRVTCVVDYFGPSDFLAFPEDVQAAANPNGAVFKLLGGTVKDKADVAKQASPTTFVSKDDPPFLMLHGTRDNLVPLSQSELLNAKLKEAGVDSTLVIVKDAGHGFGGPEIDSRVKNFFAKHLQGKDVTVSAEPITISGR